MGDSRSEALINEYKGNLFEFLVASHIAREKGVESDFLTHLEPALKEQLSFYERRLREMAPNLPASLSNLATSSGDELLKILPAKIKKVEVIGKISLGERWKEADILIDREMPISLKLCKYNSFVNTKSAGIKSFISKYFSDFPEATTLQKRLDQAVDAEFTRMGHTLYELCGLEYHGQFDSRWPHSDRPGQLPTDMREIVVGSYHKLMPVIYTIFEELIAYDRPLFERSLLPLLGVGSSELIQVSCFYRGDYLLAGHSVVRASDMSFEKLAPINLGISSFDLLLCGIVLQIRIKPMNRFNTPAFKVNCSIRKQD